MHFLALEIPVIAMAAGYFSTSFSTGPEDLKETMLDRYSVFGFPKIIWRIENPTPEIFPARATGQCYLRTIKALDILICTELSPQAALETTANINTDFYRS